MLIFRHTTGNLPNALLKQRLLNLKSSAMKTRFFLTILVLTLSGITDAQTNWEKYEGNPVFSTDLASWASEVANPTVIFEDQVFKMWFSGYKVEGGQSAIGYTESPDGINWVISDEPVIFPGNTGAWDLHRYPGCVIRVNDTLKMWYTGSANGGDIFSIGFQNIHRVVCGTIINNNQFKIPICLFKDGINSLPDNPGPVVGGDDNADQR